MNSGQLKVVQTKVYNIVREPCKGYPYGRLGIEEKLKKYFLRPFPSVRSPLKADTVTKHIDN